MCINVPLLLMMMMSTFTAHDTINLNAQCAERGGGRGADREKDIIIRIKKKKKTHGAKSFTKQVRFQTLRNTAKESASLIVCGRAFQSLRAELEKARKPNCFFGVFQQHLESVGVVAIMSEGVVQEPIGE